MLIPNATSTAHASLRRSIILCLCARRDPAVLGQARELFDRAEFAWEAWYRGAKAEGVGPLLYQAMRGREILPVPVEAKLRLVYLYSLRHYTRVHSELEKILLALAGAGMPVVLLKGAALVEALYGDVALRPMIDLDLLLPREQVAQAAQLLGSLGYSSSQAELQAGATITYESQALLYAPSVAASRLELHWNLFDQPYYQQRIAIEPFWRTSQPVSVGKARALVFSPENQVLHLAAHLALHHGSEPGLLWQNDIVEALHRYRQTLDWDALLRRAQECDLVLSLQIILPRLADEWGAPVPAGFLAQLRQLRCLRPETRAVAHALTGRLPPVQSLWSDLQELPGWRERVRFTWVNMCPSPAYMRARYHVHHPALLPLYYPYRWLDGIRITLARIWTTVATRRPAP